MKFRALHGQAPPYICDLMRPYASARSLRSSDQHLLMVPRTGFRTRGDRSIQAVGPRVWNELPLYLRSLDSVDAFLKANLRHSFFFFFKRAF